MIMIKYADLILLGNGKMKTGDNMAWECPYCGTLNDDDETMCSCCDYDEDINQGWIGENY